MSKRSWIVLGAVVVAAVVLGAAWANWDASAARPSGSPAPGGASPTVASAQTAVATSSAPPTPTSGTPTRTPVTQASAAPPRASGPPRLAYAAFLRRVNDDRATVETLNSPLSTAAQAQDPAAVRHAAVDILDFVDTERDWLRDNPPADCYAAAHASAGAMLDAYGAAADAFIAWAQTGGGFGGLGALGKAIDSAQVASDALTTFGHALEATTCPA